MFWAPVEGSLWKVTEQCLSKPYPLHVRDLDACKAHRCSLHHHLKCLLLSSIWSLQDQPVAYCFHLSILSTRVACPWDWNNRAWHQTFVSTHDWTQGQRAFRAVIKITTTSIRKMILTISGKIIFILPFIPSCQPKRSSANVVDFTYNPYFLQHSLSALTCSLRSDWIPAARTWRLSLALPFYSTLRMARYKSIFFSWLSRKWGFWVCIFTF